MSPKIAAELHIIFKFRRMSYSSYFVEKKEAVPIPINAAATNLEVIGSIVVKPKKLRNQFGKNIRGIAKSISTMK